MMVLIPAVGGTQSSHKSQFASVFLPTVLLHSKIMHLPVQVQLEGYLVEYRCQAGFPHPLGPAHSSQSLGTFLFLPALTQ